MEHPVLIEEQCAKLGMSAESLTEIADKAGVRGAFVLSYPSLEAAERLEPRVPPTWIPLTMLRKKTLRDVGFDLLPVETYDTDSKFCLFVVVDDGASGSCRWTCNLVCKDTVDMTSFSRWRERHASGGLKSFRKTFPPIAELLDHDASQFKEQITDMLRAKDVISLRESGMEDVVATVLPDGLEDLAPPSARAELSRMREQAREATRRIATTGPLPTKQWAAEAVDQQLQCLGSYLVRARELFGGKEAYQKAVMATSHMQRIRAAVRENADRFNANKKCVDRLARLTRCAVCGKAFPAPKSCGRCKDVGYCSKEHQRQHWPEHKATCKAFAANNSK